MESGNKPRFKEVTETMENERITRTTIHTGQQPAKAQIQEIEKASAIPIIPDEDAPELTMEQYAEMATFSESRNSNNRKRT